MSKVIELIMSHYFLMSPQIKILVCLGYSTSTHLLYYSNIAGYTSLELLLGSHNNCQSNFCWKIEKKTLDCVKSMEKIKKTRTTM